VRRLFEPVDRDPNSNRLGLQAPWFYRDFTARASPIGFKARCDF
jgi:hypothetical protein